MSGTELASDTAPLRLEDTGPIEHASEERRLMSARVRTSRRQRAVLRRVARMFDELAV